MRNKSEFHTLLVGILGSSAVYFQPPTGLSLVYPCITYKLSDVDTKFADNNPYLNEREYMVTVIDRNPDTIIPEKLMMLSKSSFDRHFTSDNLNHYVFRIYF